MGLIIGPLLLAWLLAAGYSLFVCYGMLTGDGRLAYGLVVAATGLLAAGLYVALILAGFRTREEVWVFEIPVFFLLNRYALLLFVLATACHLFRWSIPGFAHTSALCCVLMLALSAGTVVGTLSAGAFVERCGIRVTY